LSGQQLVETENIITLKIKERIWKRFKWRKNWKR